MVVPVIVVMVTVIMRRVAVFVAMGASVAIGTAFGGEGQGSFLAFRAHVAEHMGDDRIVLDQQAVGLNLAGRMAVANMPANAREVFACDD